MKVAGLKVKLPFIFTEMHNDEVTEGNENQPWWVKAGIVFGIFIGGSYLLKKLDDTLDRKRL